MAEASPICRGKNLTLETVLSFVDAIPKTSMPKEVFLEYGEGRLKGWKQTHSQIARQMALYYEDTDGICHPRFEHVPSMVELLEYSSNWAKKYFIPNPYTPSLKGDNNVPTNIYAFLKNQLANGANNFEEACNSIFGIKLNNLDKVRCYLTNFTDIIVSDGVMNTNIGLSFDGDETINPQIDADSAIDYYNYFSIDSESKKGNKGMFFFFFDEPTQQKIYYGCPGTGKSFQVKKLTEGENGEKAIYFDADGKRIPTPDSIEERTNTASNVFRTTFHPDYDYATFVGTYKPIMKPVDSDGCESGQKEELSYDFVPQVFTNAYIRAYKSLEDDTLKGKDKNVYLIIEEINRGNCAQIFGDLFQLLDRTNGYSDYSVTPDTELKDYLCKQGINHDKLRLPANLHIYATMNTSDQSLFPMDSAFKRRWAMEYIPIKLSGNKAENYKISLYDHEFKWTDFLKQVNAKIRMATDSEDKQMGEFFVKSEIIELDEFRNKIMFYIWNDVCKEHYSATRLTASYFMRDSETSAFTFAELFGGRSGQKDMQDATPGELILGFMKYLGVEEIPEPTAE